ncbi:MAG: hypothetical protein U0694_15980 [Anaerolineae bacterium]
MELCGPGHGGQQRGGNADGSYRRSEQGGDAAFDEVRALFANPDLRVPNPFPCWSPAQDKLLEVTLEL